jgi:probable selenium-dependent hydroxylase accessory protein YqeC
VHAIAHETLAGAFGLGPNEVVALVGAGGKTTALRLLGAELTAGGNRVITTTTTAMLLREMVAVGPVLRQAEGSELAPGLKRIFVDGQRAAVVHSDGEGGKVVGLSPATVDRLWALGLADYLIVEADGSRGLPFKAFGPHEPRVPAVATTIVDVAGLDALGVPLTEERVHRADVLASILGIPLGSEVTTRVVADGLRAQVGRLRRGNVGCRIVVLLNKADSPDARAAGLDIALQLLGRQGAAVGPGGEGDRGAGASGGRPDSVVVGSLRYRRFAVVAEEA